ncbi:PREDICTED: odorant receptor 94b-like [Papilio polytes]|uniref:odorant receptor 94b-like n=1 Tax=Papilio polytes TaxID=76194 RepID=UPI0006762282|nr:PREDICTED: odorant receptor 94b-like [Papilio polytes]WCC57620.1 odorant receptor 33 [Papilio polytes]
MNPITGGIHWLANVAGAIFFAATSMQVVELILAKDDPKRLFECFSVLSFCGMGIIKLISLRRNEKSWRYLLNESAQLEIEELKEERNPSPLEYDSDNENNIIVSKYAKRYSKSFKFTFTLLPRIYSFTAIIFIVSPFIQYALWQLKGQKTVDYPHILPVWVPFAERSIFWYILSVTLETIAAIYCVCVHIAFDLTIVGLMIFIHGQFSLLHAKSEQIASSGKECTLSSARDVRAHMRIKNCHRFHIALIQIVKQLNLLTKNILGFYFWLATVTLCSVAVQLKSDLSTTQLISLLQYMGATLTQLFLYCNYGDSVLNMSSAGIGRGPQGSAWWCLSPRVRKELLLLMMGMSRRYQLYAGPFFSLNLPSFIQIVRTAYSYYAVLRQKST